jgi:hypothetical protein
MGAAGSVQVDALGLELLRAEAAKPEDGSDIENLDAARAELVRLRSAFHNGGTVAAFFARVELGHADWLLHGHAMSAETAAAGSVKVRIGIGAEEVTMTPVSLADGDWSVKWARLKAADVWTSEKSAWIRLESNDIPDAAGPAATKGLALGVDDPPRCARSMLAESEVKTFAPLP